MLKLWSQGREPGHFPCRYCSHTLGRDRNVKADKSPKTGSKRRVEGEGGNLGKRKVRGLISFCLSPLTPLLKVSASYLALIYLL